MEQKQTLVPYLGIILADVTHLDEGLQDYVIENNQKMINFIKHKKIYDRVTVILEFQIRKFEQEPLEPLYTYVYILPTLLNNRELHILSTEIEPSQIPLTISSNHE